MSYHHGDLRGAVLAAAARAVERDGPGSVNLRALAREVGVTHTAPRHHFGDKRGVLTALAAQGYDLLTWQLQEAAGAGTFLDLGVAYVAFALERPAHFQVLFRPDLVDTDDAELTRALAGLSAVLAEGSARFRGTVSPPTRTAGPPMGSAGDVPSPTALAAWGMAHGLGTLALAGALGPQQAGDLLGRVRAALRHLSPDGDGS